MPSWLAMVAAGRAPWPCPHKVLGGAGWDWDGDCGGAGAVVRLGVVVIKYNTDCLASTALLGYCLALLGLCLTLPRAPSIVDTWIFEANNKPIISRIRGTRPIVTTLGFFK